MYLVVGGAGYIGSQVVLDLLRLNKKVLVIDKDYASVNLNTLLKSKYSRNLSYEQVDITDIDALDVAIGKHSSNIKVVIHLAGLKSITSSWDSHDLYSKVNAGGTYNLVAIMVRYSLFNLVYGSTGSIYGDVEDRSHKESDSIVLGDGLSPYAANAYYVEEILSKLVALDNRWKVSSLRIFNVIGADKEGFVGEPTNSGSLQSNLFPSQGQLVSCMTIETTQCDNTIEYCRDYTHVMDVAHAIILSANRLAQLKISSYQVYNVCSETLTKTSDLVAKYERATRSAIFRFKSVSKIPQASVLCGSNAKIHDVLGWSPKYHLDHAVHHTTRFQGYNL